MPCPLDRAGQGTLVLGASAGLAARLDPRSIRYKPAEERNVFVIDNLDVVRAHNTDAAAASASPGPLTVGACRRAAGTAARPVIAFRAPRAELAGFASGRWRCWRGRLRGGGWCVLCYGFGFSFHTLSYSNGMSSGCMSGADGGMSGAENCWSCSSPKGVAPARSRKSTRSAMTSVL